MLQRVISKIYKQSISVMLIITLISSIPLTFFAFPKKAEAVCTPFTLPPIPDVLSVPINPSVTSSWNFGDQWQKSNEWFKTCILDGLATAIAKQIIKQLTMSIVRWINSGFKGNPSFVQNPGQFFGSVADRIAGGVIENIAPFLCSPFKLNIQLALALNYSSGVEDQIGCTLSDVENNVKNFANGGTWDNWFQVTQNPNNNQYGAFMNAEALLSARIETAQGTYERELNFGRGFLSFRSCNAAGPGTISGTANEVNIPGGNNSALASNYTTEIYNGTDSLTAYNNNNLSGIGSFFANTALAATTNTSKTTTSTNIPPVTSTSISPVRNQGPFTGQTVDAKTRQVYDSSNPNTPVYGTSADPNDPNCLIQTPGAAIEGQLENTLGSDLRGLEIAQSIDQIVAALVGQLVTQALGGIGGLTGAGKGSSSSSGSGFNYQNLLNQSGAGTTQIPNLPLTGTCIPNVQNANIGDAVTWNVYVPDLNGQVSYVWDGDEVLSGSTASVTKIYTANGEKKARVYVSTPGATGQSQLIDCTPSVYIGQSTTTSTLTCSPTPLFATVNQPVTWNVYGLTNATNALYIWQGDEGLNSTSATAVKNYTSPGSKSASVTVVANGVTSNVSCIGLNVTQ